MRILVTGSREWTDRVTLLQAILDAWVDEGYRDQVVIVHGGAPGADTIAGQIARFYNLGEEAHPADWAKNGKAAGPIRNREMVAAGADICLAFYKSGASNRGTANCVAAAEAAAIPVRRYWDYPEGGSREPSGDSSDSPPAGEAGLPGGDPEPGALPPRGVRCRCSLHDHRVNPPISEVPAGNQETEGLGPLVKNFRIPPLGALGRSRAYERTASSQVQTLLLDIETTPNLAHVWGLWNQNVSLNQLRQSTELLCFSAKWLGEPATAARFYSVPRNGRELMVVHAHELLDEADAVMTWSGKRFDIPHLNREFLEGGLKPPSPYKQIDLCEVVKRQFRFPSNKLQYVSTQLGLRGKVSHEGHELWVKCMAGDPDAWRRMERYNKQDVILLEHLYRKLQPWIPGHPSHAAFEGAHVCPRCGSSKLQKRGHALTVQSSYQRYQCNTCGGWSRGTKRLSGASIREVANA